MVDRNYLVLIQATLIKHHLHFDPTATETDVYERYRVFTVTSLVVLAEEGYLQDHILL